MTIFFCWKLAFFAQNIYVWKTKTKSTFEDKKTKLKNDFFLIFLQELLKKHEYVCIKSLSSIENHQ